MLARQDAIPTVPSKHADRSAALAAALEMLDGQSDVFLASKAGASPVALPPEVTEQLRAILRAQIDGRAISIVSHEAELSTKQAADLLNVSRPYICKLIDEGKLPARMVNRHRRVKRADLEAFEAASKARRLDALSEMAREARALGLE